MLPWAKLKIYRRSQRDWMIKRSLWNISYNEKSQKGLQKGQTDIRVQENPKDVGVHQLKICGFIFNVPSDLNSHIHIEHAADVLS